MATSLSGEANGSALSSTALTTLKIAVFAPMPRARVIAVIKVKPGFFRNIRAP
jgi:hypothetical protein